MFVTALRAHCSIQLFLSQDSALFISYANFIGKRLVFAKWDKWMERSSLALNLFFQEACQFQ